MLEVILFGSCADSLRPAILHRPCCHLAVGLHLTSCQKLSRCFVCLHSRRSVVGAFRCVFKLLLRFTHLIRIRVQKNDLFSRTWLIDFAQVDLDNFMHWGSLRAQNTRLYERRSRSVSREGGHLVRIFKLVIAHKYCL